MTRKTSDCTYQIPIVESRGARLVNKRQKLESELTERQGNDICTQLGDGYPQNKRDDINLDLYRLDVQPVKQKLIPRHLVPPLICGGT